MVIPIIFYTQCRVDRQILMDNGGEVASYSGKFAGRTFDSRGAERRGNSEVTCRCGATAEHQSE